MVNAIRKTLSTLKGWLTFLGVSIGIFLFLIMIPVWTTPGNDFFFQLSILDYDVLAIMIILSLGNGLLIAMQVYIHKEVTSKRSLGEKGRGAVTAGSLIISVFSSTIACAACYSAIFAFLGLGVASFLVTYRMVVFSISIAITFYAIYHASRRINNNCEVCTVI